MAILDIPVWSFLANWDSEVTEGLEFFTKILTSKNGSEQRRAHRQTPRRTIEFEMVTADRERAQIANFVTKFGGETVYLPLWFEQNETSASSPSGAKNINMDVTGTELFAVGDAMLLTRGDPLDYEVIEIASIASDKITSVANLAKTWPAGTLVFKLHVAQMTDQPTATNMAPTVDRMPVKFVVMEEVIFPGEAKKLGPLITSQDFYVAHSYHDLTDPTGRTEDQFLMASAFFGAYDVLKDEVGEDWEFAADYYRDLAQRIMDAVVYDPERDPILRYGITSDSDLLNLPHYRYAARTNAVVGELMLEGNFTVEDNAIIMPDENMRGNVVDHIWKIYETDTAELFFPKPWAPAYDYENPTVDISYRIENWIVDDDKVEIPMPLETPDWVNEWSMTYSYDGSRTVEIGHAFKLVPTLTPMNAEKAVYAGDLSRFYERALSRAIAMDNRAGKPAYWTNVRNTFRKTDLKARRVDDQRWIIEPLVDIEALPAINEEPDGFFCYSNHPNALGPGSIEEKAAGWSGSNFWTRDDNGDLVAVVPNGGAIYRTQYGRVFPDQWRPAAAPHYADQYLMVEVSCSKKPAAAQEFFLVWVSAKSDDDESARWFANIGAKAEFVATSAGSGTVITFLIPRTDFKKRTYNDSTGATIWGTVMPDGQILKSFGISAEITGTYGMRLRSMRLLSGVDAAWVSANLAAAKKGYPMQYAPGVAPTLVNLHMGQQRFYDENFSPMHGYQFPEVWKLAETEANSIFSGLVSGDLPVPSRPSNAIAYPISAAGKTPAAMLMEQQLTFLDHAQKEWVADGGTNGPFAHTYTMNTYDRYAFVDSSQSKWVYENIRPYSQWGGFQYRIAEGLAQTIDVVGGSSTYATSRALAVTLLTGFVGWLNVAWPNLSGTWAGFDGLRVFSGDESDYVHRFTGDENPFVEVYSE